MSKSKKRRAGGEGKKSPKLNMGKASTGIAIVFMGNVIAVLWLLSVEVLPLAASNGLWLGGPASTMRWVMMLILYTIPILTTCGLLGIAGPVLCLAVPREAKANHYLYLSIAPCILFVINTVVSMLIAIPAWMSAAFNWALFLSIPSFVLFLGRLASHLGKEDIRNLAKSTLIYAFAAAVLNGVAHTGLKGPVFLFAGALAALLSYLRYLRLLQYSVRAVVESDTSGASTHAVYVRASVVSIVLLGGLVLCN
jgi:hypothetical protein